MSPEQARSEDLDVRSDIFSFGVVLFEMATGKKPFTGTNVVLTLHAVMNSKPASPRSINPAVPPELEAIIGKAMEKDRNQRYQNAAEMKAALARLKKGTEPTLRSGLRHASGLHAATHTFQKRSSTLNWLLLGLVALLLTLSAAVGAWWFKHRIPAVEASNRTIAVLPLVNINHDAESEFLRFALADEVANALTYAHSLEIRPSTSTQKYVDENSDALKAGRELGVGTVVTGHFLREKNTVMVTLEAVEVKDNRLIWTGTLTSAADNLIALQSQMSQKVRQELVPALGLSRTSVETSTAPVDREGYNFYLRSIAMPHDGDANKKAIASLEQAVKLDPNYAPAWEALGRRYYFDAIYSGGGAAGYKRSNAALEHAMAVDPGRVGAAAFLATNEVESGNLDKAYTDARNLVAKRPESALAHYSLAYVSRYAGLLDEAQRECDKAFAIDSRNFNWRSCSFAFFEQGKSERAMDYLNLDAGSDWSNAVRVPVLMREGKAKDAQRAVQQMPHNAMWLRPLLQACLNKAPAAETHRLAELAKNELLPEQDSELKYHQGAILAACGEKAIARDFLHKAVAENYCATQALQSDPLLANMRGDPEFRQIVQLAAACQQSFKVAQGMSK